MSTNELDNIKRNADVLWQEVNKKLQSGVGVPAIELNRVHWIAALQELEILRDASFRARRASPPESEADTFSGPFGSVRTGICNGCGLTSHVLSQKRSLCLACAQTGDMSDDNDKAARSSATADVLPHSSREQCDHRTIERLNRVIDRTASLLARRETLPPIEGVETGLESRAYALLKDFIERASPEPPVDYGLTPRLAAVRMALNAYDGNEAQTLEEIAETIRPALPPGARLPDSVDEIRLRSQRAVERGNGLSQEEFDTAWLLNAYAQQEYAYTVVGWLKPNGNFKHYDDGGMLDGWKPVYSRSTKEPAPVQLDDPPKCQCDRCGRKTWETRMSGKPCGMRQPHGGYCDGTMTALGEHLE